MTNIGSLSSASGLALLTGAAQYGAGLPSPLPGRSAAPSSSGVNDGSPTTLIFSISHAGIVQAAVNHHITQSEAGQGGPTLASAVGDSLAVRAQNNELSSEQISQALYSGRGLILPGGSMSDPYRDTFAEPI